MKLGKKKEIRTCTKTSVLRSSLLDCKFNLDWTGLDWKIDWTAVSVHTSLRPVQSTVQGFLRFY